MSDTRVRTRTTDKFLETLGVSKRSNDSHLDECIDRLEAVKRQAASLRGVLGRYFVGLRAYHDVSFFIAETICTFYGEADKSSHVAKAWKRVHEAVDRTLLTKLEPVYEKAVLGEADAWLGEIEKVFAAVRDREGLRLEYDHYRRKVSQLDEARAKASAKGRPLKQKEQERLDRNREKLATWRDTLQAATDRLKGNITQMENSQHRRFDKVLQRLLQFEDKLFGETGRQGKVFAKLQETLAKQLGRDSPEWARLQERLEVEARADEVLRERIEAMAVGEAKEKLQQMLAKAELPPSLADEVIGPTPSVQQGPTAPSATDSEGVESSHLPRSPPGGDGSEGVAGESEDLGKGQQGPAAVGPAPSPPATAPVSRGSPVKTAASAAVTPPRPVSWAPAAVSTGAASPRRSAGARGSGSLDSFAASAPGDWFGSDPFANGAAPAPAPAPAPAIAPAPAPAPASSSGGAPDPFSTMQWSAPPVSQPGGVAGAAGTGADPFSGGAQDPFAELAASVSAPPASSPRPASAAGHTRWMSQGGGASPATSPALAGPGAASSPVLVSAPAPTSQGVTPLAPPPSAHPPAASAPPWGNSSNPFDSFAGPQPSAPQAAPQGQGQAQKDPYALFGQ